MVEDINIYNKNLYERERHFNFYKGSDAEAKGR